MTAAAPSSWLWVDGRIVDPDAAVVPGSDPGLLTGHAVFETTRLVRGEPFALSRHLRRLRRSAALAEVEVSWSDAELRAAAAAVVAAAPPVPDGCLGRLRITIGARATSPLVMLAHVPGWPATSRVASVHRPIDAADPLRGAKVTSRLAETLSLVEARRRGADEALRFNGDGHLAEGSASNVFLVLDGRLVTPSISTGCLPGVTRELVVELVEGSGGRVAEGLIVERDDLTADDLARAEESFLTSATRDIHPVVQVDDRGLDAPGPVTAAVATAYVDLLDRSIDP